MYLLLFKDYSELQNCVKFPSYNDKQEPQLLYFLLCSSSIFPKFCTHFRLYNNNKPQQGRYLQRVVCFGSQTLLKQSYFYCSGPSLTLHCKKKQKLEQELQTWMPTILKFTSWVSKVINIGSLTNTSKQHNKPLNMRDKHLTKPSGEQKKKLRSHFWYTIIPK